MKKKNPAEVRIVVNPAQMQYLTYLLYSGLYGSDMQAVHDQVFCAGLRAAMAPDVVRSITWPKFNI